MPPPDASNSGGNGLAPPNQGNGQNGNGFGKLQTVSLRNKKTSMDIFIEILGPQQGNQPQESQQPPIAILSYENENNGDGSYKWSYETGKYT